MNREPWDAIVIGGGGAGLMCAAVAGQRGARVLLIDHAESGGEDPHFGGGRCNFTNLHTGRRTYCRPIRISAARRWRATRRRTSSRLVKSTASATTRRRASCSAMIGRADHRHAAAECDAGGVRWAQALPGRALGTRGRVRGRHRAGYATAPRVVIATGGPSIPKIGATDFGHRIARQFGLRVVATAGAGAADLGWAWQPFVPLAGVSLEVDVRCGGGRFARICCSLIADSRARRSCRYRASGIRAKPRIDLAPQLAGDALAKALIERRQTAGRTSPTR